MLKRSLLALLATVTAAVLPACTLLPGTGPTSDAVHDNATAGVRSTTSLAYALVDVSADTIGFLSQPNLISFKGEFPDKRPKPSQVVVEVLRLNRIIPPVHLFALVADNFHGGHRINPCSSQVRAGRVAKIVKP